MDSNAADGNPGSASGDVQHGLIERGTASRDNICSQPGPVFIALNNEVDKSQKAIDAVKERRTVLNAQKRVIAKDLKNIQKKRARLKKKACNLTTPDIVELLVIRTKEKKQRQEAHAARHAAAMD